ncbi:MAG TPA: hypothetical protein VMQ62_11930, partial [Dongiaceae bacterium]|nr:hypothetical protein [Dongiaceae bacterium]
MKRRIASAPVAGAALAVLGAASLVAGGGAEPDLRRLFPKQAPVTAPGGRLVRLDLPADLLAACRPDLSDLRLFDAAGRETAFLVDAGAPPATATELIERARPEVIDVTRQEVRRETGPPLRRETITLALPARAPKTGRWALLFEARAREFVARVGIDSIAAGGAATPLLPEGSIFRLPAMHGAERLRILLPPDAGARVRVTLESETAFFIEPTLMLESARRVERAGSVAVPLEILATTSADGKTVVDLARPAGLVPDRLRVGTTTALFDRAIEASDEGPAGAGRLGAGRLFRFPGLVAIGDQEIGLGRARGDR